MLGRREESRWEKVLSETLGTMLASTTSCSHLPPFEGGEFEPGIFQDARSGLTYSISHCIQEHQLGPETQAVKGKH